MMLTKLITAVLAFVAKQACLLRADCAPSHCFLFLIVILLFLLLWFLRTNSIILIDLLVHFEGKNIGGFLLEGRVRELLKCAQF